MNDPWLFSQGERPFIVSIAYNNTLIEFALPIQQPAGLWAASNISAPVSQAFTFQKLFRWSTKGGSKFPPNGTHFHSNFLSIASFGTPGVGLKSEEARQRVEEDQSLWITKLSLVFLGRSEEKAGRFAGRVGGRGPRNWVKKAAKAAKVFYLGKWSG